MPYTVRAAKSSSIVGIRMETAATAVKAVRDLRNDGFTDIRVTNIETWEDHDEDSLAQIAAGEHKSQAAYATPGPAARPAP